MTHRVSLADLPPRCFISHAYADAAAVDELCARLPETVKTVVFPQEEPDPRRAVSNRILPKIRECSGLIYLTGDASDHSFWVPLERDFALRSGLEVFAYSPRTGQLRVDDSPPMALDVSVVFHRSDEERVRELLRWMAEKRNFVIDEGQLLSTFGGLKGDVLAVMEEMLERGGVVLWLMGSLTVNTVNWFYSHDFVEYLQEDSDVLTEAYLLEFFDIDPADEEDLEVSELYYDLFNNVIDVFARVDPELSPKWRADPFGNYSEYLAEGGEPVPTEMIDLLERAERKPFNWNRIDDLIVRLYAALQ